MGDPVRTPDILFAAAAGNAARNTDATPVYPASYPQTPTSSPSRKVLWVGRLLEIPLDPPESARRSQFLSLGPRRLPVGGGHHGAEFGKVLDDDLGPVGIPVEVLAMGAAT